jgi:hypothetical protein
VRKYWKSCFELTRTRCLMSNRRESISNNLEAACRQFCSKRWMTSRQDSNNKKKNDFLLLCVCVGSFFCNLVKGLLCPDSKELLHMAQTVLNFFPQVSQYWEGLDASQGMSSPPSSQDAAFAMPREDIFKVFFSFFFFFFFFCCLGTCGKAWLVHVLSIVCGLKVPARCF